MSFTKEIITLQVGHYSNFVGTHWWNIQESSFCYDPSQASSQPINHEVLFREGVNSRGEVTFTPRLIALDLKGSLRSLPEEGTLYSLPSNTSAFDKWPGEVDVKTTPAHPKNEFLQDMEAKEEALYSPSSEEQSGCPANDIESLLPKKYDLDKEVDVWSDFLRTHLHPRSVLLLDDYHHDNQDQEFDFFGCGTQISQKENLREAIEDRIRSLTEESDYLQGFQLILDGYNGFAGITYQILLHLDEEYGQKSRICYPLFQPFYKGHRFKEARLEEAKRSLTALLCLDNLSCASSLFSPLSLGSQGLTQQEQHPVQFPHLSYKPELPYHTSAILAVALQTLTLPSRFKDSPMHLTDVASCLSYGNRKLVSSHMCLPLPFVQGEPVSSLSFGSTNGITPLQALTPQTDSQNALIQSVVYCGIPQQACDPRKPSEVSGLSVNEIVAKQFSKEFPSAALFVKGMHPACKVVAPYPDIFKPNIGGNGLILNSPRPSIIGVQSVPVLAVYRNSSACSKQIDDLICSTKKMNLRKFHQLLEMNTELDDIKEALHNLEAFADNYKDQGFLMEA